MNDERLYQIIRAPHVSEKGTMLADQARQFIFEVQRDATKAEIRQAVEKAFDVKVVSVRVVNVRGKVKRFGRSPGQRSDWKKAYVRLEPGQDIDFVGGQP
jgi:large subunit ribosomal protein L23